MKSSRFDTLRRYVTVLVERAILMRRNKNLSIDDVIDLYSRKTKKAKLTVRKLDRGTVLIEGTSNALKFLAQILLALTEEQDCGIQFSPSGAGKA